MILLNVIFKDYKKNCTNFSFDINRVICVSDWKVKQKRMMINKLRSSLIINHSRNDDLVQVQHIPQHLPLK